MSDQSTQISYVRREMLGEQAPPSSEVGIGHWIKVNLLTPWYNAVLTVIGIIIFLVTVPPFFTLLFVNGVWTGENREVCATIAQGGVQPDGWVGICWAYVGAYVEQFIYGRFPDPERWRVNIVFLMFAVGLVPLLMPNAPYKRENIVFMLIIFPVASFILLTGGHFEYTGFLLPSFFMEPSLGKFILDYIIVTAILMAIAYGVARGTDSDPMPGITRIAIFMGGLAVVLLVCGLNFGLVEVPTDQWGGLLVTMVIAVTGIVASLPLGIALALGRRSEMPIVRLVSVVFIEFWRGVPLITVLFMSSVMLPLFLPDGVDFDKLLRALIGVALFSAAYMAEVVRGGLQAIPKGQYEGAMALGLGYGQMMQKIILPQALTLVIPGIVNTFIGLFKDTTLVLIIGLFDFLGQINFSFNDPTWGTPVQKISAYVFASFVYFCFCFGMSQYSTYMERRLDTGHKS